MTQKFLDLISGRTSGTVAALARFALGIAQWPYRAGVAMRNSSYDRQWLASFAAGVPVISVGNLTTGGTGKTPAVEFLSRFYRDLDLKVAILSRGYGSDGGRNDEALVLEENLPDVPHLQGQDRVALAATAVAELESEILIIDDGFQHRRMKRDLDIVLIDATNPWGYGQVLPRGLMREPKSSLRRANAVMLTRCDQAQHIATIRAEVMRFVRVGTPIVETEHQPLAWIRESHEQVAPEALQGRPALAFCGIGNPEAFRATLGGLGINPIQFRTFPDHHGYTRADVEDLRHWADRLPLDAVVLTTQKDVVKIRLGDLMGRPLYALRIGLVPRRDYELSQFLELCLAATRKGA